MKKLLFVCLGNICRSPTAEGVMKHLVSQNNLDSEIYIDSCGTSGHHSGENADPRMQTHAQKRGYNLESIARGFNKRDFQEFDYILTMDESNYSNILKEDPSGEFHDKVIPMVNFCKKVQTTEVPDPYYGGPDGFEEVLDILEDACENLLDKVKGELT
ncbi:MAG: low molecular weight phosphotyrosine protein phosphatase [Bdellovibrionales bacterium]|nr:low molecular weight phosphotyrosine protein phosphatase [Bdellovibrionales bacterium]NQZ17874.1 low molecular weight phosphotyrosine protein phosphatase [Bdellovibrionales bacterium]